MTYVWDYDKFIQAHFNPTLDFSFETVNMLGTLTHESMYVIEPWGFSTKWFYDYILGGLFKVATVNTTISDREMEYKFVIPFATFDYVFSIFLDIYLGIDRITRSKLNDIDEIVARNIDAIAFGDLANATEEINNLNSNTNKELNKLIIDKCGSTDNLLNEFRTRFNELLTEMIDKSESIGTFRFDTIMDINIMDWKIAMCNLYDPTRLHDEFFGT